MTQRYFLSGKILVFSIRMSVQHILLNVTSHNIHSQALFRDTWIFLNVLQWSLLDLILLNLMDRAW